MSRYATWSERAFGTTAGVTVTRTGSATKKQVVTAVQFSGDAATSVQVESPANTVLWRKRYAAAFDDSIVFPTPLIGAAGADILLKVVASTANSEANLQGYSLKSS